MARSSKSRSLAGTAPTARTSTTVVSRPTKPSNCPTPTPKPATTPSSRPPKLTSTNNPASHLAKVCKIYNCPHIWPPSYSKDMRPSGIPRVNPAETGQSQPGQLPDALDIDVSAVSYTHLRAHETGRNL